MKLIFGFVKCGAEICWEEIQSAVKKRSPVLLKKRGLSDVCLNKNLRRKGADLL
jgi:hypothetical protein